MALITLLMNYVALLQDGKLDAVSIATPNNFHYSIVLTALAAGIHVFCEKPLALTQEQAEQMTMAAQRAGVIHGINFQYRALPCFAFARQFILAGHLGTIYHVQADYLQDWEVRSRSWLSENARKWRTTRSISGTGVLGDLGTHLLDLLQNIVEPVTRVNAQWRTIEGLDILTTNETRTDDYTALLIEFAGGALGQLTVSHASFGYENAIHIQIQGSLGALRLSSQQPQKVQLCTRDSLFTWTTTPTNTRCVSPIESFIQGLLTGVQATPNFEDGLSVQCILASAEQSIGSGGCIAVHSGERFPMSS